MFVFPLLSLICPFVLAARGKGCLDHAIGRLGMTSVGPWPCRLPAYMRAEHAFRFLARR